MMNDDAPQRASQGRLVKSAARTVRILEVLAASPTPLSAAEIHAICGYPQSSVHSLIGTLRSARWIDADSTGSRYTIGTHALLAAKSYYDKDAVVEHAQNSLESLRNKVRHTVHLARLDLGDVLYLATRGSLLEHRHTRRVGRTLPAHVTALGQALLAELHPEQVAQLLPEKLQRYTAATIVDRVALMAELDEVRRRGWAFEREQGSPGLACIAVTLPHRSPAIDALSISMPADSAADPDEVSRLATILTRHAHGFAQTLLDEDSKKSRPEIVD